MKVPIVWSLTIPATWAWMPLPKDLGFINRPPQHSIRRVATNAAVGSDVPKWALLFDCDGVIVEVVLHLWVVFVCASYPDFIYWFACSVK
jgi:hypothetical protein